MKTFAVGFLIASGCAVHTLPLTSLPLATTPPLAVAQRTSQTIEVLPFEDQRGDEYTRFSPDAFIPVANLFHTARADNYPEQERLLVSTRGLRRAITTGAFGNAMPSLLMVSMRQMRLSDAIVVGGGPSAVATPAPDYIVTGRILRTRLQHDRMPIVAAALGLFGVPFEVARYDLAYEVTLYDANDRGTPLMTKTYAFKDKSLVGAYYNHEWAYPMFVRGLEATLPNVVSDVATAIAARPRALQSRL